MALSFDQPLQRSGDLLRKGFGWWVAELRDCVPRALAATLAPSRALLVLTFSDEEICIELEHGGDSEELGRFALSAAPDDPIILRLKSRLAAQTRLGEIRVILPTRSVMRRRVELPGAAAGTLQEAVGFEIDRLTPFKSHDVVFRVDRVPGESPSGAIFCDLIIAPRARVQAFVDWARLHAIRPDRLYGAGEGGKPVFLADLPLGSAGAAKPKRKSQLTLLFFIAACLLGAAVFTFHLDRQQAVLDAYLVKIAEAKKAAAVAIAARDRISQLRTALGEVMARRRALPLLADMLADLTGRLPDDSWLTELRLSEGHIALSGYSSSAAGLVPIVEASPIYQDVRLSAPVTSDSRLNRERFSIEAAITLRGAK